MDEVPTQRLVGTRPLMRDADELHPICSDHLTLAETRALLVRDAVHWKKHRCGCWIWREDGVVVAHGGLVAADGGVTVTVFVAPARRGQGLGTEISRAAAAFADGLPGPPVRQ